MAAKSKTTAAPTKPAPTKPAPARAAPAAPTRAAPPARSAAPPARSAAPAAPTRAPARAPAQPPAPPAAPARNVNAPPRATPAPVMETTNTALAKAAAMPAPVLVGSAPAYLVAKMQGGQGPRGLEKADRSDLLVPRIVLVQSMSRASKKKLATEGDIIDNISSTMLAAKGDELRFIPVALSKSRIMFAPLTEGGGILCRSDDTLVAVGEGCGQDAGGQGTRNCADCVFKEWNDDAEDPKDRKPGCTMFYNILGLLPDFGFSPYVWSLKSTQVKVAKRFITQARQTGADLFAQEYALRAVDATSPSGDFVNFDFRPLGWVDEEAYGRGEALYNSMEGKSWTADVSDLEEPVGDDEPAPEAPPAAAPAGPVYEDAQPADEEAPF